MKNKESSKEYFNKIKEIWKEKDILIVEGLYSRSGEGNDLFSEAKSIRRILCPPKNAYSKYLEIEKAIKKYSRERLILLILGPTSKVIIDDMKEGKNQMIDLGHLDSEYEWFKLGVDHKVRLPNKHTAEFNYDDNRVILKKDKKFDAQVLKVIK